LPSVVLWTDWNPSTGLNQEPQRRNFSLGLGQARGSGNVHDIAVVESILEIACAIGRSRLATPSERYCTASINAEPGHDMLTTN
jgi:hypothetical protein